MGISTISPPKIVVTSTIFLYLVFLVTYGDHILDYFCLFKVIFISFIFKLINFLKSTNAKELEHMESICEKVILVTKHENYIYTSKLKLWIEFFVEFFCDE